MLQLQEPAYLWQAREVASVWDGDQVSFAVGACMVAIVIALSVCRHNAVDREAIEAGLDPRHLRFALTEYPGGITALTIAMGMKERTYLYKIIDGHRNLTVDLAARMAKAFADVYARGPKGGWWLEFLFGLRLCDEEHVARAFRAVSKRR